jgi:flagellar biosynthetic protein FliO
MTVRLLSLLAPTLLLNLPLAACAAQPVDGPAAQQAQQPASPQQAARAANTATPAASGQAQASAPAQAPATTAPASQPSVERAPGHGAAAATGTGTAASTGTVNTAPAAPLGSTPVQETPAASPEPAPAPAPAIGAGTVTAPAPTPGPVTMPAGSATGNLLQTLFALIVVLAVLGALAWFLKRYGPKAGGGGANLRIVGSLNLGGRERLLVVEVGNQWIVVGASPGRVNALATMPKQEGIEGTAALAQHAPSANSFADWLKQTIDKRK